MLGANEAEYARERARLSARVAQVCSMRTNPEMLLCRTL